MNVHVWYSCGLLAQFTDDNNNNNNNNNLNHIDPNSCVNNRSAVKGCPLAGTEHVVPPGIKPRTLCFDTVDRQMDSNLPYLLWMYLNCYHDV